MTMLLDAGAFVAVERGDRDVVALVKRERLAQRSPLSHGGIVAQIGAGARVVSPRWHACCAGLT